MEKENQIKNEELKDVNGGIPDYKESPPDNAVWIGDSDEPNSAGIGGNWKK